MHNFIRKLLREAQYLTVKNRWQKFNEQLATPENAQREKLASIILSNQSTDFGRRHFFNEIPDYEHYRTTVPVRTYADFAPDIKRAKNGEKNVLTAEPVEMFGITSGTEASPKFLPITRSFIREQHYMHLMWLWQLISARPLAMIGDIFSVVSPAEISRTAGGIPCGAMSGKHYRDQSIPLRMMQAVPYAICEIPDSRRRNYLTLLYALAADLRSVNCANPSTLAMFAQILADRAEPLLADLASGELNGENFSADEKRKFARRPRTQRAAELRDVLRSEKFLTPKAVWKNLCAINTWQGGCAEFYLPKIRETWGDSPMRCWGLRATEGIFSVPSADNTASGAAAIGGHFLEFTETLENPGKFPETRLAHELEIGKRYRLIITTGAGLYRYDLGDIVEVTGFNLRTPEIAFSYRAGGVVSITGEKLTPPQVLAAVAKLSWSSPIAGFTVGAEWGEPPRYLLAAEPQEAEPRDLESIATAFDKELMWSNSEYRDKRLSGRIASPKIILIPRGSYQKHRDFCVNRGNHDGQIKPPQLLAVEAMRDFMAIVRDEKLT